MSYRLNDIFSFSKLENIENDLVNMFKVLKHYIISWYTYASCIQPNDKDEETKIIRLIFEEVIIHMIIEQ